MRKPLLGLSVFIIIIIILCVNYYGPVIGKLPHGAHEWGQADRLALAMKFYDNGMNFFKPATYNRHAIDGIVGVEFPIQAYIAAALGHLFGRGNINTCFRVLDIIIACMGLFFLFFTCFKATRNFVLSLIPPMLIFSSPAFIEYAGNYLPDTFATSIAFISFFYMYRYVEAAQRKDFYITLLLLTLATLIKTSIGPYFVGFAGYCFLRELRNSKLSIRNRSAMFLTALVAGSIIFGYNRYNNYLNQHYNSSLFFANIAPFESMKDVEQFLHGGFRLHIQSYFSVPTYVLLFTISAAGIALLSRSVQGRKHLAISGIFLSGALIMIILLGKQLSDHDYYVIPILFPLFGYFLSVSMIAIAGNIVDGSSKRAFQAAAYTATLFTIFFADFYLTKRRSPEYDRGPRSYWMHDGAKIMDKFGISKNETILALQEEAPNLTSVYMDRNSFSFPWHKWDRVNAAPVEQFMKDKNIRLAVCETKFIKEAVAQNPSIFTNFKIVGEDGQITVMELTR